MLTREILAKAANDHGALPVIRSAKVQYKSGARPFEPLVVTTQVRSDSDQPADYVISLSQSLLRTCPGGETQELVTAQIDLCFVDAKSKALLRVPSVVREQLR